MTKGKKTISKINDSTSESLRRALRFGRGETSQVEDVHAVNLDALEASSEDINGLQNLARPLQIPGVRFR